MTDPAARQPMLDVASAQARLLALAEPVGVERVPLDNAAGRWLAEPLVARLTRPALNLSAMDGYALRFADLGGPLRVIGESAAGRPFAGDVGAGQAVRIFTGAAVPDGADTILIQEDAARDGAVLTVTGARPERPGAFVRPRGQDFAAGDMLGAPGERLTPARIALTAAAAHGTLAVRRRIRVAIASTGDELVAPGEEPAPGQLPDCNAPMLAAMLRSQPVEVVSLGALPDRLDALTGAFAAARADILVVSGGASVGDHDLVRPALEAAGARIDFWRVAMRPGKPMMAGTLGDGMVLGLPGNTVSAFVTAHLFLLPLIARMSGAARPLPPVRRMPLAMPLPANRVRADYIRAAIADGAVLPLPGQDSGMITPLAAADALIVRPPHVPAALAGDSVEIHDLA